MKKPTAIALYKKFNAGSDMTLEELHQLRDALDLVRALRSGDQKEVGAVHDSVLRTIGHLSK